MTPMPDVLKGSGGNLVRLGRQIGKGGEGAVYEVLGQGDVAAKLYWPDKAAARRDKINAMVAAGWSRSTSVVAYPTGSLLTLEGAFAGFTMRLIGGHKPLHLLYSPGSRKLEFRHANFLFMIRAALNAAKAAASVHATGCLIGDINHSGFLISPDATVALIDSDSFDVMAAGRRYPCQVATPEYTPPELQGANAAQVVRTRNHDNFGLAILIFQLLFMGRHPYSGRFLGAGDMPIPRAITEFRFTYATTPATMQAPLHAPQLADFPSSVAAAFEAAFGRQGVQRRPTADEWIAVLGQLERSLQQCSRSRSHHHVQGRSCAWCRIERAVPGFVAFTDRLHVG
jgi:DNA-binding helix-hairpin-helix protein with protein kinase domain